MTKKIRYYSDKHFNARLLPPAPVPKLKLSSPPSLTPPNIVSSQSGSDDSELPEALNRQNRKPDTNDLAEAEAVGREIAELLSDEPEADALVARDELLAELQQSIDR